MNETVAKYKAIFGRDRVSERLVFFSDAVFAIALTLLVIDLRVPEESNGENSWDVIQSILPGFLAFAISFGVIALNWAGHHRKFKVIKDMDATLIVLNFALLFVVAFTPFPTSLMAEYPAEVPSVVLYASVVMLLNLLQLSMWVYAYRKGMIDERIDDELYRFTRRNLFAVPIVFGASILIALFIDPLWAMYSWFLLWPLSMIFARLGVAPARSLPRSERP